MAPFRALASLSPFARRALRGSARGLSTSPKARKRLQQLQQIQARIKLAQSLSKAQQQARQQQEGQSQTTQQEVPLGSRPRPQADTGQAMPLGAGESDAKGTKRTIGELFEDVASHENAEPDWASQARKPKTRRGVFSQPRAASATPKDFTEKPGELESKLVRLAEVKRLGAMALLAPVPEPVPYYHERAGLREAMRALLKDAPRLPLAIVSRDGAPGNGTTEAALVFAQELRATHPQQFFIDARSRDTIVCDLRRILSAAGLDRMATSEESYFYLFRAALERLSEKWVVIYDGAGVINIILEMMPSPGERGVVMVTSRHKGWFRARREASLVAVSPFGFEDSVVLLRKLSGRAVDDPAAVETAAVTVHRVPAALALLGLYSWRRSFPFSFLRQRILSIAHQHGFRNRKVPVQLRATLFSLQLAFRAIVEGVGNPMAENIAAALPTVLAFLDCPVPVGFVLNSDAGGDPEEKRAQPPELGARSALTKQFLEEMSKYGVLRVDPERGYITMVDAYRVALRAPLFAVQKMWFFRRGMPRTAVYDVLMACARQIVSYMQRLQRAVAAHEKSDRSEVVERVYVVVFPLASSILAHFEHARKRLYASVPGFEVFAKLYEICASYHAVLGNFWSAAENMERSIAVTAETRNRTNLRLLDRSAELAMLYAGAQDPDRALRVAQRTEKLLRVAMPAPRHARNPVAEFERMIQAHDEAQGRLASSSGSKAQNTEGTRAPASATNAAATGETDKADPLAQDEDVPVDLEADDTAERVERSRVAHRLAAAYGSLGDIAKRKEMLELALSFADAELPSMRAELEAVVESARASAARLSAAKHHAAAAMKKYLRNAELALSNLVHPSRGDILEELAEIAKEEGKSSMHSRLAEQVLAQREREAAQQARGAFDKDAQQGDVEGGAGRVVPSGEQVHRMAPASSAGAVRNVGAQSPEPASRADESVLGAMLELGAAQATDGELDKATDTFSKALAMLEATKGREHSALLQVMLPFSAALAAKGDAERALDVALRAKDIVSKLPVDEGLQLTSRVFTLLGAAYAAGDRIDEAIATFRALLKRLEERYAEGTPESVDCLIHLATALARSGDRDGAREVALNALAIDERFLRHDSERLAHTRLRVATVLVRTVGDGKAAEVVLRRLLEGRQQRAPDPELVRVNGMLSAALGAQGKFAEQSVVLEKMLDDLTRLRASPLDVAAILYELGVVYSKMQRIERGLTMIVRSVELLEGSLAYMSRGGGSIAPRMRARIDGALATARFAQGKLYGRLGKNDKMRETFSAVRAELASKLGPQNVHVRLVDAVLDPAGGAWQIDEQLPESLLPDDDVAALRRE